MQSSTTSLRHSLTSLLAILTLLLGSLSTFGVYPATADEAAGDKATDSLTQSKIECANRATANQNVDSGPEAMSLLATSASQLSQEMVLQAISEGDDSAPLVAEALVGEPTHFVNQAVALDSGEPALGSFTVDGMTFAVTGKGEVELVAVGNRMVAGNLVADPVGDDPDGAEGAGRGIGSGWPTSPQPQPAPSAEASSSQGGDGVEGSGRIAGSHVADLPAGDESHDASDDTDGPSDTLVAGLIGSSAGDLPDSGEAGAPDAIADGAAEPIVLAIPGTVEHDGITYAVTSAGPRALAGCAVDVVEFPATVASVDEAVTRGSSVEAIEVAEGNPNLASYEGVLYDADYSDLLLIPEGKKGVVRIHQRTSAIAPGAFSHCASVTSVEVDAGNETLSLERASILANDASSPLLDNDAIAYAMTGSYKVHGNGGLIYVSHDDGLTWITSVPSVSGFWNNSWRVCNDGRIMLQFLPDATGHIMTETLLAVRPGYSFSGWTGFNQSLQEITGNTDFDTHAAWTPNPINHTWYPSGGTIDGYEGPHYRQTTYNEDTTLGDVWELWEGGDRLQLAGHCFVGWFDASGNAVDAGTPLPAQDACYYARWALIAHPISYDAASGELPEGVRTSYTIEDATFDLPMPTRYGYQFDGWEVMGAGEGGAVQGSGVEDATLADGSKVTRVKQGTWGNLACTARWTLRYDLDVPVCDPGNVTFEVDSLTGSVRVAAGSSAIGEIRSRMAVPVTLESLACEGLDSSGHAAPSEQAPELEAIFGVGSASKVRLAATFGEGDGAVTHKMSPGGTVSLAALSIPAATSATDPGRLAVTYGLELDPGLPIPPVRDAAPVARLTYTVGLPQPGV